MVTFGSRLGSVPLISHGDECGHTKALGAMMKSIPQIADGLAALSIEELQHRIFELAMEPDVMLHPLRPKSGWRNQIEQTPFGLQPNAN
jgi:hypothetical protein